MFEPNVEREIVLIGHSLHSTDTGSSSRWPPSMSANPQTDTHTSVIQLKHTTQAPDPFRTRTERTRTEGSSIEPLSFSLTLRKQACLSWKMVFRINEMLLCQSTFTTYFQSTYSADRLWPAPSFWDKTHFELYAKLSKRNVMVYIYFFSPNHWYNQELNTGFHINLFLCLFSLYIYKNNIISLSLYIYWPLASTTEHWALSTKTARHKNSFYPRPCPTWTTHNTPQYCTSVNNSSNLHLYI